MNEEDRFEARHQEIHDAHTGATITLGSHAGGHRWLRIAMTSSRPGMYEEETKTSTITFGPDGQVLKILPHHAAPVEDEKDRRDEYRIDTDPRAMEIKEELQHLDEVEASLHDDKSDKVDKHSKHGKK